MTTRTSRGLRRDFSALIDLRWRQARDDARYWLRVLGYEPGDDSFSQKAYVFYLFLLALLWIYTVGSWILERALEAGAVIQPQAAGDILTLLSYIPYFGFILITVNTLRSTPLKLTFPDIAYVAGSPIRRSAPLIVGFVRYAIVRAALLTVAVIVLSTLLTRVVYGAVTVADVVGALLITLPLAVLIFAVGWVIGSVRMAFPRLAEVKFLWLTPLVLAPLPFLFPDATLWVGRAFSLGLIGEVPTWVLPAWVIGLAVTLIALGWLGERLDMIRAAEESQLFARIQAIGLLQFTQPRVQARIRLQASRAGKRAFWRLQEAQGWRGLVSRAALSFARHPLSLIGAVVWAVVLTLAAANVIVSQLPAQLWIGLAIIAGLRPPAGLLYVFEQDVEEPFLRQFLPTSTLSLLWADALLPFIVLTATSTITWVLIAPNLPAMLVGVIVIVLSTTLLTLCGAFGATRRRSFESRFFATLISFFAAMVAASVLGSPLAGIAVLFFAVLVLAGWLNTDT